MTLDEYERAILEPACKAFYDSLCADIGAHLCPEWTREQHMALGRDLLESGTIRIEFRPRGSL